MKITIEQHGIKSSVEYHDDDLDVYQLGALVHSALTGVGWQEITLEKILNKDAFDWDFVVEKEKEEVTREYHLPGDFHKVIDALEDACNEMFQKEEE